MRWLIKSYMVNAHIESLKELATLTGIEYRTLTSHIKNPEKLRLFEVRALDEALKFRESDLIAIMRGVFT